MLIHGEMWSIVSLLNSINKNIENRGKTLPYGIVTIDICNEPESLDLGLDVSGFGLEHLSWHCPCNARS